MRSLLSLEEIRARQRAVLRRFQGIAAPELERAAAEHATFETSQRIAAIVRPRDVGEVSEVVKELCRLGLPYAAYSRGYNWGLGSRVPADDGTVLIDLSQLATIRAYDAEQGCITIEAGVTFDGVARFLEDQGARFFLPTIGGPPSASVVGNMVERGDGVGPHGNRCDYVANLEVILPGGDLLHTGFDAWGSSLMAPLSRDVPGPHLAPLFMQSNFGIVAAATFWLRRRPEHFETAVFSLRRGRSPRDLIRVARELHGAGIIEQNSFAFWNVFKFLTAQGHLPRDRRYSLDELRMQLPSSLRDVEWLGYIPLYGASRAHGRVLAREVRRAVRPFVDSYLALSPSSARIYRSIAPLLARATNLPINQILDTFYFRSVALGIPSEMNTRSLYWRKRSLPSSPLDPNRDRCGVHWACYSLPFDGRYVERAHAVVYEACAKVQLEPNIAFLNPSSRELRTFVVLSFDRECGDEERAARECLAAIEEGFTREGFVPFRVGIQNMHRWQPGDATYCSLVEKIKRAIDPAGLLAPSRYGVNGDLAWRENESGGVMVRARS